MDTFTRLRLEEQRTKTSYSLSLVSPDLQVTLFGVDLKTNDVTFETYALVNAKCQITTLTVEQKVKAELTHRNLPINQHEITQLLRENESLISQAHRTMRRFQSRLLDKPTSLVLESLIGKNFAKLINWDTYLRVRKNLDVVSLMLEKNHQNVIRFDILNGTPWDNITNPAKLVKDVRSSLSKTQWRVFREIPQWMFIDIYQYLRQQKGVVAVRQPFREKLYKLCSWFAEAQVSPSQMTINNDHELRNWSRVRSYVFWPNVVLEPAADQLIIEYLRTNLGDGYTNWDVELQDIWDYIRNEHVTVEQIKRWGLSGVYTRSRRWHNQPNRRYGYYGGLGRYGHRDPKQITWKDKTPPDGIILNDLHVVPLLDGQQLLDEGERMHHCVGSYYSRCAEGLSRIFSIRRRPHTAEEVQRSLGDEPIQVGQDSLGTLEFIKLANEPDWRFNQLRAKYNKGVTDEVRTVANRFHLLYNQPGEFATRLVYKPPKTEKEEECPTN